MWILSKIVFNMPASVTVICKPEILAKLSKSLEDDLQVPAIRKNIISLYYRLSKVAEAEPALASHFKEHKFVAESAANDLECTEDELEEGRFIREKFKCG